VCGADVTRDPIEVKRRIGYLPEGAPAYPDMTPAGFLDFIAHIRGFSGAEAKKRVAIAVERVAIGEVVVSTHRDACRRASSGASASPRRCSTSEILIMDERPMARPQSEARGARLIAEMAPDKAIIISTHILEEVDAVCSRAMIIAMASSWPTERRARSRRSPATTTRFA